jgi:hypothetical protein
MEERVLCTRSIILIISAEIQTSHKLLPGSAPGTMSPVSAHPPPTHMETFQKFCDVCAPQNKGIIYLPTTLVEFFNEQLIGTPTCNDSLIRKHLFLPLPWSVPKKKDQL